MTWIKLAEPPKPVHECILPEILDYMYEGSIWQCDGCPKQWVISVRDDFEDYCIAPVKYFEEALPDPRDLF